jgi:hypothetical protein
VEAFAAKLAPLGTDVGRACYAAIQRLRAGSSEGAGNADSETPPPTSLVTPPASNETTPVRATSSTGPSIVVPQPESDPPARRWPRYAAASVVSPSSGGLSRDVASDATKQRDYTHKACLAGSTLYCGIEHALARGDSLQSKGLQNYALLKANCDKGDYEQRTLLGENRISGKGVAVDKDKGTALLGDACAKGVARACSDVRQPGGQ